MLTKNKFAALHKKRSVHHLAKLFDLRAHNL